MGVELGIQDDMLAIHRDPKPNPTILRLRDVRSGRSTPMTFPYKLGINSSTQFHRVLYTNYKDSVIKGGRLPIPNKATFDHGTDGNIIVTLQPEGRRWRPVEMKGTTVVYQYC